MSAHLTEEEQIEALKRWWKENGKNTVAAVVVAVVGYFGFEFWQENTRLAAEAASDKYQTLIESVVVAPGQSISDVQKATAVSLAGELKAEAAASFYGQSAALFMAKMAVEAEQLDKAEAELQWVLAQSPERAIELATRLRLSRVQAAAEKFDMALATLESVDSGRFAANYAEVRGDILLAQGKPDQARAAYQLALKLSIDGGSDENSVLQSKVNDLTSASQAMAKPLAAVEVQQ